MDRELRSLEREALHDPTAQDRSQGSDLGIYLVPYFRGEYFDKPDTEIDKFRGGLLAKAGDQGLRIHVIVLDLSFKPSPSKR